MSRVSRLTRRRLRRAHLAHGRNHGLWHLGCPRHSLLLRRYLALVGGGFGQYDVNLQYENGNCCVQQARQDVRTFVVADSWKVLCHWTVFRFRHDASRRCISGSFGAYATRGKIKHSCLRGFNGTQCGVHSMAAGAREVLKNDTGMI